MKNIIRTGIVISAMTLGSIGQSAAQLNPFGAQYFQNRYLANPSMAALENGLTFNGGFRQLWSKIPGSPVTNALTAEYRVNRKVGTGIRIVNEGSGLIKTTRVMGSYAYHLPLDEASRKLHLGLSFGFMNERLMNEKLDGEQGDITVSRFNRRETYLDGDFGAAYTADRLELEVALPNLKTLFAADDNDAVDQGTFYTSAAYRWTFGEGINAGTIQPKAAFRGVRGFNNMVDLGVQTTLINNQLILSGMYHTSRSATFGFGLDYREFSILGLYSTGTAALRTYTSGNFEIGIRYHMLKNGY
ncbi:MAG TPA: PorP/SprF family type IX secretion system membrane protein [Sphingobacteriaceae bacterium]